MSSPVYTDQGAELSESQRSALLKLLADEDPVVYRAVRDRILSCGLEATSWLRPHSLSDDAVQRRRIQEIVDHLERQSADDRFLGFCLRQSDEFDLEQAAWLLASTRYPEINVGAYEALLDTYAADIEEEVDQQTSADNVLAVMNQLLFERLGFHGNETDYYDPENSYLNRVMDRRTGNPVALCLVYLFLARRLRLPFAGVGLPGHFVCRYQTPTEELYVDAFNQGRLLTKADCIRFLQQTSYGMQESLLTPATPRRTLLRICSNLHQIHLHLKQREETARFQRYIVALAR